MSTNAQNILKQLNALDLSNPESHRDAVVQAQSLVHALQDPADKAMENIYSVCLVCGGLVWKSMRGTNGIVYHAMLSVRHERAGRVQEAVHSPGLIDSSPTGRTDWGGCTADWYVLLILLKHEAC